MIFSKNTFWEGCICSAPWFWKSLCYAVLLFCLWPP